MRGAVLSYSTAHVRSGWSRPSSADAGVWWICFGVGRGWLNLSNARLTISRYQISLRDSRLADGIRGLL